MISQSLKVIRQFDGAANGRGGWHPRGVVFVAALVLVRHGGQPRSGESVRAGVSEGNIERL